MSDDAYLSLLRRWLLSSPPGEWALRQVHALVIGALRQGPVPQHVAFVMDGNRRFARSRRMETIEGHSQGFVALSKILDICYRCGVKVVTVYAFAVDNYNRPQYEIDGLMQMAKVRLDELTQEGELLDKYGARIRILGERSKIREDVLEYVDRAVEMTKHNSEAILNICFPYGSREEMTSAVRSTVEEFMAPPPPRNTLFPPSRITQRIIVSKQTDRKEPLPTIRDASPARSSQSAHSAHSAHSANTANTANTAHSDSGGNDGDSSSTTTLPPDSPPPPKSHFRGHGKAAALPNPEDITVDTLCAHMYTAADPPIDLFIRTSGVERLSNFLCWQCHQDTQIFFLECLWPDFSLYHFVPVLMEWQWRQKQKERDGRSSKGVLAE